MRRWSRWFTGALTIGLAAAATVTALGAQPPARRAVPIMAARTYSGFLHNQHVAVVGTVATQGAQKSLVDREGALRLLATNAEPGARIEARGMLLDIGRMRRDDPRLAALGLLPVIKSVYGDRWPRPGEDIALAVTSTAEPPATLEAGPPLRAIALEPERFEGEVVSVTGEFRGRNLYADLPEAPTTGGWDFVLRYADAAIWVTGVQPKGRDFILDPTQRRDTGKWFRVSGVVRTRFGVTWLEAKEFVPAAALAVPDGFTDSGTSMPATAHPIEVVFVAPVQDAADVRLDAPVRVQFSRDLDPASLADRIRVAYAAGDSVDRGEPVPPAALFTTRYDPASRSLEIRPSPAWARFRQVTVSFLEGVRGADGAPLTPFSITFNTGG